MLSAALLLALTTAVCDPLDSTACAQPLKKGEVAPFTGQLLTETLSLKLGQKAERCEELRKIERERNATLSQIEIDYRTELLRVTRENSEDVAKALQHDVVTMTADRDFWRTEALDVPFYAQPWFSITVGVVTLIGGIWLGFELDD